MDKLGIITFHRTSNFGSCLQAYGLYKKIADLGWECELIDYRCPAIEAREEINSRMSFNLRSIAKSILYQPIIAKKYRQLLNFLGKNAVLSRSYYPATIDEANHDYNRFMVGSDIVWGVDITEEDYNYFLDFADASAKKLAFASSVGNYNEHPADSRIAQLLTSFDRIAVREETAVSWVHRLSGQKAHWVCDPTMLLTASQWDELVRPKKYNGYSAMMLVGARVRHISTTKWGTRQYLACKMYEEDVV